MYCTIVKTIMVIINKITQYYIYHTLATEFNRKHFNLKQSTVNDFDTQ